MQTPQTGHNNKLVSYLNAIPDDPESDQTGKDFFGTENENNLSEPFPNPAETDPLSSKEKDPPKETESSFFSTFLIDLIQAIKRTLFSIKNTSLVSDERFNDIEFTKLAQRSITEDIKKIDSVLNSLLNYIQVNTPIIKSNTLSLILEEVLEANGKQIQDKKINIFKKCEKDLPETHLHNEQVRFILNSVLQYAILCTPPNGKIGLLTKSFDFHDGTPDKKISQDRTRGYIEAVVVFASEKEFTNQPNDISESLAAPKEETLMLILQLVKEILQKHHGNMAYEVDPKKPRARITLRFPIERRKMVYYEPISI